MSRPQNRRKAIARSGVKQRRGTPRRRSAPRFDSAQWDDATVKLWARSRGMCERCGDAKPTERHHRMRRRDGGDELSNLLFLCTSCHGEITDKPESETHARRLGYIVRALAMDEPRDVPVLLWGTTWVRLDEDGTARACDAPRM